MRKCGGFAPAHSCTARSPTGIPDKLALFKQYCIVAEAMASSKAICATLSVIFIFKGWRIRAI